MKKLSFILIFLVISCSSVKTSFAEEPSVVKVVGLDEFGSPYICTGFILDKHTVVTAAHCAYKSKAITIMGKKVKSSYVMDGYSKENVGIKDIAVIIVNEELPENSCRISSNLPFSSAVRSKGFPTNDLATSYLNIKMADNDIMILSGAVFEGMSGGPVYDANCNIYGVLSFTDKKGTAGAAPLNKDTVNWINTLRQKEASQNAQ